MYFLNITQQSFNIDRTIDLMYKQHLQFRYVIISLKCNVTNKLDWANSAPTYPQTGHHSRHRF